MNSIKIECLTPTDKNRFEELAIVFNIAFEEDRKVSSTTRLKQLLENPMFYTLVTLDDNKVIAGLTAYELPSYYNDKSEFYIYDIAV